MKILRNFYCAFEIPIMSVDDDDDQDVALSQLAQEYTESIRRGCRPTIEEFASNHPTYANEIRELFPALNALECIHEPASQPSRGQELPDLFGEFRILRKVGEGGMGQVYEAIHVALGRRVALKVLHKSVVNQSLIQRFSREAKVLAKLNHTNIVPLFDFGEVQGVLYYAMQFIEGTSLDKFLSYAHRVRWQNSQVSSSASRFTARPRVAESASCGFIQSQPTTGERIAGACADDLVPAPHQSPPVFNQLLSLPPHDYQRLIAKLGAQLAEALSQAHMSGVLHRDVKPANILFDNNLGVWLADFGLAYLEGDSDITTLGDVLGTLRYMPPERFQGHTDTRGDLYGLGATLYELLALRPAFSSDTQAALIGKILHEQPPPLRQVNPRISKDLETVVHKAMAREVGDRYQSATGLSLDLLRFYNDEPVLARRSSTAEKLLRIGRRNPVIATMVAVIAMLLVAISIVSVAASVRLQDQLSQTRSAKKLEQLRVYESLLMQATVTRKSNEVGSRFRALTLLQEAALVSRQLGMSLESRQALRDEAIAALCRADARDRPPFEAWPLGTVALDFDPSLERYARINNEGEIAILRAVDHSPLEVIPAERAERLGALHGSAVRFSADGRWLLQLLADENGEYLVRMWDAATTPVQLAWQRSEEANSSFGFTPDSRHVFVRLAAKLDNDRKRQGPAKSFRTSIRFFAVDSGSEALAPIETSAGSVVAFHPKLECVAFSDRETVSIVDLLSRQSQTSWRLAAATHLLFSRDGETLFATTNADGRIHSWDVGTQKEQPSLRNDFPEGVVNLVSNHQGDMLISTSRFALQAWELSSRRLLWEASSPLPNLRFSRDDKYLAGTYSVEPKVNLLEVANARGLTRIATELRRSGDERNIQEAVAAVLHPNGKLFAATTADGTILWDIDRARQCGLLPGRRIPVSFDSEGCLLTYAPLPEGLRRWRIAPTTTRSASFCNSTGDALYWIDEGNQRHQLAESANWSASRDGSVLAMAAHSQGAFVYNIDHSNATSTNHSVYRRLPLGPQYNVFWTSVSPDGKWVATGSNRWGATADDPVSVTVWDARSGRRHADLLTDRTGVPRFSPDGRWLAVLSGAYPGGVRWWQVDSWKPGAEPAAVEGPGGVTETAFELTHGRLAIQGGYIRVLDIASSREAFRLQVNESSSLAPQFFTADGSHLVAVDLASGEILIWNLKLIDRELHNLGLAQ
jgi:serine/threonine protein kinase/WD40 repeat protein